jgi:hypothetical protein
LAAFFFQPPTKGKLMNERTHLETLLTALDATPRALRRDSCGDWAIKGKRCYIYADGTGFLIVVSTGNFIRLWTNTKLKLAFCRVTQDGDDEGCLHLDHLPTAAEADLIRDALGIKRKRHYTPDQMATIAARLKKNATRDPSRAAHIRQKRKRATTAAKTDKRENFSFKRASTVSTAKNRPPTSRPRRKHSKGGTV